MAPSFSFFLSFKLFKWKRRSNVFFKCVCFNAGTHCDANLQQPAMDIFAAHCKSVETRDQSEQGFRGRKTFIYFFALELKISNFLDTLSNKLLSCDTAHAWQSIIIRVTYLGPAFQTSIHLFCQEETGSFARKCNYYTALLSLYVAWHFRMAVYLSPHFIEASTTNHNLHSGHVKRVQPIIIFIVVT